MDDATIDRFLADNPDIVEIDAVFPDLSGRLRGKRLPRAEAAALSGGRLRIPQAIMALTTPGECLDADGRGISDGDPDGAGVMVPGSVTRLPWTARPTAQVLMRMVWGDGDPLGHDPRNVLDRVLARLRASGLRPVTAFEVEFHVIDRKRGPDGSPVLPPLFRDVPAWSRSHGTPVLDTLDPFFETVRRYAEAMGLRLGGVTSETGIGQFELNLHHGDDPARSADEVLLLRQILWNAARSHDLDVTFMAKPFADQPGNGLHLHLSMVDGAGRNLFAAEGGETLLRHAIGGIRALMPDCLALHAPHHNAYRRFVPGNFVPINRSWGFDNRSVAFRVPGGDPSARRIEHRVAGGDAHPHLVMASVLASVLHGIEGRIDPGPPSTGNANLLADPAVPTDLPAALAVLAGSAALREALGPSLVDVFVDVRAREYRRLLSFYSPVEYEWYL
ncbi:glutamine synthetase family protein [Zavarzinia aquatilis]|uniref:Glutamine synthetase n=1 Tax=Zavarzinia aquatilis TaxID=2211142 RepID=A0A317EJC2_9PROT|nr:glutamine synthetase family protein [Zavarzinia aquatilis]PWR25345.1 glutamine synthetase [Zavarzinia aquatilis]